SRAIVNEHRAVGLEHEQPNGLRQDGGQPSRVANLAACDDQAHGRRTVLSLSDSSLGHDPSGLRPDHLPALAAFLVEVRMPVPVGSELLSAHDDLGRRAVTKTRHVIAYARVDFLRVPDNVVDLSGGDMLEVLLLR